MRVRFGYLLILALITSSLLVACGDPPAVPTYPGATPAAVPDAFKPIVDSATSGFKNGINTTGYKSPDSIDKVGSTLSDGFKKNGWDVAPTSNASESLASRFGKGAFFQGYGKGDSGVIVVGVPGSDATRSAGIDIKDGESFFMVITGKA